MTELALAVALRGCLVHLICLILSVACYVLDLIGLILTLEGQICWFTGMRANMLLYQHIYAQ